MTWSSLFIFILCNVIFAFKNAQDSTSFLGRLGDMETGLSYHSCFPFKLSNQLLLFQVTSKTCDLEFSFHFYFV